MIMASTHKTVACVAQRQQPDFRHLFMDQLQKIYWAEKQLLKLIPKMEQASSSATLSETFRENFEHTQNHVIRLERVCDMLQVQTTGKKCKAMAGLIEEINELIAAEEMDADIRDTGLLLASRKIDYYEIAAYNSLHALATRVNFSNKRSSSKDCLSVNRLFTYPFMKQ